MSLHTSLDGIPLWRWLVALASAAVALVILLIIVRVVRKRWAFAAAETKNAADDVFVSLVASTKLWFLLACSLFLATRILATDSVISGPVVTITLITLWLQIGVWAVKLFKVLLRKTIEKRAANEPALLTTRAIMSFFGRLIIWTLVVLVSLDNLGVNITSLVAGLGISGIAVALALQSVLGDIFASLSIVLDNPFRVGDFIIIGEYLGTVEQIGIKTTRLRSLSGEQLVFSNNDLLSSRIRNYQRMEERRVVFQFGVVYQTPTQELESIPDLVRDIVTSLDKVRLDRAHFKAFGDSSLDFEVVYYVLDPDYNLYMDIQQDINLGLVRSFRQQGIEFAYPTRTLYTMPPARSDSGPVEQLGSLSPGDLSG